MSGTQNNAKMIPGSHRRLGSTKKERKTKYSQALLARPGTPSVAATTTTENSSDASSTGRGYVPGDCSCRDAHRVSPVHLSQSLM